ncbi:MAG: class I SAM-dependent methyltransferase [Thermodesulfobacteriota bacterium]
MDQDRKRICPVERAGHLDMKIRRWFQDPRKILAPYVKAGMTVLDYGCGPGFFTLDLAEMVGRSGRVIAADLQKGMLEKLKEKMQGTDWEGRIRLHQCAESRIGLSEPVDFVLCFYMVHEIPDQAAFFRELHGILQPEGKVLIAEPPVHVSKAAFDRMIARARAENLVPVERPRVFLSKAVVLKRDQS